MSDFERVSDYFSTLQREIVKEVSELDGRAFVEDCREHERGISRVMHLDGAVFERAGVNYSKIRGDHLPSSASKRHPEHAGRAFQASGISMIFHPKNPHAPTMHANCRIFQLEGSSEFWFGGGMDLTPYYVYEQDAQHWHAKCHEVCQVSSQDYQVMKEACDRYFYLPHRKEHRGIGGLFFDDYKLNFDQGFKIVKSLGERLMSAYLPIIRQRMDTHYSEVQRRYQEVRRGRYVEFNLLYDRGTRFGLEWGGRSEAILVSMPPSVRWEYEYPLGIKEKDSLEYFTKARDWLQPEQEVRELNYAV